MMQKAAGENFHPVQDFKNLVTETANTIAEGEAMASASQRATQMYESLVPSSVDKQLTATYNQMVQAWESVKAMDNPVRIKTARFLSRHRQRLQQQMKGYRVMLDRMRDMSAVNSAAALMRHQNQRRISTKPGPVPIAITNLNTVRISLK